MELLLILSRRYPTTSLTKISFQHHAFFFFNDNNDTISVLVVLMGNNSNQKQIITMKTKEQMGYLAPEIEVNEVMTELGIAMSGNVENPDEGWEM